MSLNTNSELMVNSINNFSNSSSVISSVSLGEINFNQNLMIEQKQKLNSNRIITGGQEKQVQTEGESKVELELRSVKNQLTIKTSKLAETEMILISIRQQLEFIKKENIELKTKNDSLEKQLAAVKEEQSSSTDRSFQKINKNEISGGFSKEKHNNVCVEMMKIKQFSKEI